METTSTQSPDSIAQIFSALYASIPPEDISALLDYVRQEITGLDINEYNQIIEALYKVQHPEYAWDVFTWACEEQVAPNSYTFHLLIKRLKSSDMPAGIEEALRVVAQHNLQVDVECYNAILSLYKYSEFVNKSSVIVGVVNNLLASMLSKDVAPNQNTYEALADLYNNCKRMDMAWEIVATMRKEGFAPTLQTYHGFLAACENMKRAEQALEVFEHLQQEQLRPTSETHVLLIKALLSDGQVDLAIQFFQNMQENRMPVPLTVYNRFIQTFGTLGNLDLALDMFTQVKASGLLPDSNTHEILIEVFCANKEAYRIFQIFEGLHLTEAKIGQKMLENFIESLCKEEQFQSALNVYWQMQAAGMTPIKQVYQSLIAAASLEQMDAAWQLYEQSLNHGQASVGVYSGLTRLLEKANAPDRARTVVDRMRQDDLVGSKKTYHRLINIFIKSIDTEYVISLLDEMTLRNIPISCAVLINLISFFESVNEFQYMEKALKCFSCSELTIDEVCLNDLLLVFERFQFPITRAEALDFLHENSILLTEQNFKNQLDILCDAGDLDQAADVFQLMQQLGIETGLDAYEKILGVLIQAGREEQVRSIIKMRLKQGFTVDDTSELLLKAYLDAGLVDQAWLEFKSSEEQVLSERTYIALIKAFGGAKQIDRMVEVAELAGKKLGRLHRNAYSLQIKAFAASGLVERGFQLLDTMKAEDILPNVDTYCVFISGLEDTANLHHAWDIVHRMYADNLEPNAQLFSRLINIFSKYGQFEQAWSTFELLHRDGLTPDVQAYTTLINAFGNAGQADRAYAMFERMCQDGIKPDVQAYTTLINAFGNAGQMEYAWEQFERMCQNGIKPDAQAYTSLIDNFGNAGQTNRVWELFERMQQDRVDPNIYTYTTLINAFGNAGQADRAYAMFERMCQDGIKPDAQAYTTLINAFGNAGQLEQACDIYKSTLHESYSVRNDLSSTLRRAFGKTVFQDNGEALSHILWTVEDREIIKMVANAIMDVGTCPEIVFHTAIARFQQAGLEPMTVQNFVKIFAPILVQTYFEPSPVLGTFHNVAHQVVSLICRKDAHSAGMIMFELLVYIRASVIKELIRHYSDAAITLFDPILGDYKEARAVMADRSLLSGITKFLRAEFPTSTLPTNYGFGDGITLYSEAKRFAEETDVRLCVELQDKHNSLKFSADENTSVSIPLICWLSLRPLLRQLVHIERGPLEPLWTNAPEWSVNIVAQESKLILEICFAQIDPRHQAVMLFQAAQKELESLPSILGCETAFEFEQTQNPTRFLVRFSVNISRAQVIPQDFFALASFFNYLDAERQRWLAHGTINSDFYRVAKFHYEKLTAEGFPNDVDGWIRCMRHGLDRQFAFLAEWLLVSQETAGAPRIAVHDIKKKLQSIADEIEMGKNIEDARFKALRSSIYLLYDTITQMVQSEVYEDTPYQLDIAAVVTSTIEEWQSRINWVTFELSSPKYVTASIRQVLLHNALTNLIHNAVEAIKSVPEDKTIRIMVTSHRSTNVARVSIVNSYLPDAAPSAESSMIGLSEIRYIVEKLSSGRVRTLANPMQRQWRVDLELPISLSQTGSVRS